MRSPFCVSVYPPVSTYECLKQFLWNLVCISAAHFINPSHLPVSVCVSLLSLQGNVSAKCNPPFGARQRLGEHVPSTKNRRNIIRIARRVIFYAVGVLLQESLWVSLCIPVSFLSKHSANTFPRQWRIVGGSFSMRSISYQKKVKERISCLLFKTTFRRLYAGSSLR
jgi:hypothetical protein